MLVLTRKVGEKLIIGDQITIVVSRVAGNRVTLGIEAPLEVPVLRGELSAPPTPAGTDIHRSRETSPHEQLAIPALAK